MPYIKTELNDVFVFEPKIFEDDRGLFYESFNLSEFNEQVNPDPSSKISFVQDNFSRSKKSVLRGLHYQVIRPQGKLVRTLRGTIFDVAIDIRRVSKNFGKSFAIELSENNNKALWIPPGFAHGFVVMSEIADVMYKTTDYYFKEHDRSIRYDDPDLNIIWPIIEKPILSIKDDNAPFLDNILRDIYD